MELNRREIFMNIPATRGLSEQSFEVHGNVVQSLPGSAEYAPSPRNHAFWTILRRTRQQGNLLSLVLNCHCTRLNGRAWVCPRFSSRTLK